MGKGSETLNFAADFETTTDANDCRVWLWAFCQVDEHENWDHGKSLDSFMARVSMWQRAHIYFHNLAFDGSFIIDWLFNQGYTHVQGSTKTPKTFTTLISKMAKFYSITAIFANGHRIEFRDSLKKLPMSVSNVSKAFKLDESKSVIDYHAVRPVGYQPTSDEIEYIRLDVLIVAKALRVQFQSGMNRLTVGADSLAEYKRLVGAKHFQRMFPILNTTIDDDIRRAYRGGYTYADPRFRAKRLGRGRVYDVNSLYPSVMYDSVMPYGEPRWFSGEPEITEDYPLYVVTLTFTAKLKKDHLPTIQIKGSPHFAETVYQQDIEEPTTMTCTNVDLALWQDHYELDILSWDGGWKFHGVSGFFREYIDKWMKVKATTDGGLRFIAKLHLNSLYGKFATNPDVTPKIPIMDENNIVRLVVGEEETRNPVYTPVGVFITAYARDITIRAAQQHYDSFAYADTDSLHLLVDEHPETLNIHKSDLGAWKYEYSFDEAIFVRSKCYSELLTDTKGWGWVRQGLGRQVHSTHVAGLPEVVAERVTLDDIQDGKVWSGKLAPKRVRGGIVLEDVGFTLNITA